MNFEIVKWLLIAYMIIVAILMATYYFLNLKKTGEKSFWKNMGWWSLASVIVACCAGSGMASPNTNANFICGCASLIFLIFNGLYVGLGKN
jgi:hypothetical protein